MEFSFIWYVGVSGHQTSNVRQNPRKICTDQKIQTEPTAVFLEWQSNGVKSGNNVQIFNFTKDERMELIFLARLHKLLTPSRLFMVNCFTV